MTNATVTVAANANSERPFITIMLSNVRRVSFFKTEAAAMAKAKKFAKEHGCEITRDRSLGE